MSEGSTGSEDQREPGGGTQRDRLVAAYFAGAILAVGALAGLIVLIVGDDGGGTSAGDPPSLARIQLQSGKTNGATPDGREGTPPPVSGEPELADAAAAAGCELREDLPEEGNEHLEPGDDGPGYGTNPGTSGDHSLDPQADGAYLDTPPEVNVVHSLEHGRVAFHYGAKLSDDDALAIKGLFDEDPAGMLIFRNSELPYAAAASAWTAYLGCPTFEDDVTLEALRAFRDAHRGQGPEQVPLSL